MSKSGWMLLVAANVLMWSVLSFSSRSGAAQAGGEQPFANAVQQRNEMIRELQEIKLLLKEQNALLRATLAKDPKAEERR